MFKNIIIALIIYLVIYINCDEAKAPSRPPTKRPTLSRPPTRRPTPPGVPCVCNYGIGCYKDSNCCPGLYCKLDIYNPYAPGQCLESSQYTSMTGCFKTQTDYGCTTIGSNTGCCNPFTTCGAKFDYICDFKYNCTMNYISPHPSSMPSSVPSVSPSVIPSSQPSGSPTSNPTSPSSQPSNFPSEAPTRQPSSKPSQPSTQPTGQPISNPSNQPTRQPHSHPSGYPTNQPFSDPTRQPSSQPLMKPSYQPIDNPSSQPSSKPSDQPSKQPFSNPSEQPSRQPLSKPSSQPICKPTNIPTDQPSNQPSSQPLRKPSNAPTRQPSSQPSSQPTLQPFRKPNSLPTSQPSEQPSGQPSGQPLSFPTRQPSSQPLSKPSRQPTSVPTKQPSTQPYRRPTCSPTVQPSDQPSRKPSVQPSDYPTGQPSCQPSHQPSRSPTIQPSTQPFVKPTSQPSSQPSFQPFRHPSSQPSKQPTKQPSSRPSVSPTFYPTGTPSKQPISAPSLQPTQQPSKQPSKTPSSFPSGRPTNSPSRQPSKQPNSRPTDQPSKQPTSQPLNSPTQQPSSEPSKKPSNQPTTEPSRQPTMKPSSQPFSFPTKQPFDRPSAQPSRIPTKQPSKSPSSQPSSIPSSQPSYFPSQKPVCSPTSQPSTQPSSQPFSHPSSQPSSQPTNKPTTQPFSLPTCVPTLQPSNQPTFLPTVQPTSQPSSMPRSSPTMQPSKQPSETPSHNPTVVPSSTPSEQPSGKPTFFPTFQPSCQPSSQPSSRPTIQPSKQPSTQPSKQPVNHPTKQPNSYPSSQPTKQPSRQPIVRPSRQPTSQPSLKPSSQPTSQPSNQPDNNPSSKPSIQPTNQPMLDPSNQPSISPTLIPSKSPSEQPTHLPSRLPSNQPSSSPTGQPIYFNSSYIIANMSTPYFDANYTLAFVYAISFSLGLEMRNVEYFAMNTSRRSLVETYFNFPNTNIALSMAQYPQFNLNVFDTMSYFVAKLDTAVYSGYATKLFISKLNSLGINPKVKPSIVAVYTKLGLFHFPTYSPTQPIRTNESKINTILIFGLVFGFLGLLCISIPSYYMYRSVINKKLTKEPLNLIQPKDDFAYGDLYSNNNEITGKFLPPYMSTVNLKSFSSGGNDGFVQELNLMDNIRTEEKSPSDVVFSNRAEVGKMVSYDNGGSRDVSYYMIPLQRSLSDCDENVTALPFPKSVDDSNNRSKVPFLTSLVKSNSTEISATMSADNLQSWISIQPNQDEINRRSSDSTTSSKVESLTNPSDQRSIFSYFLASKSEESTDINLVPKEPILITTNVPSVKKKDEKSSFKLDDSMKKVELPKVSNQNNVTFFTQVMSDISNSKKSQEQKVIESIQINSIDSNSSKVVVEPILITTTVPSVKKIEENIFFKSDDSMKKVSNQNKVTFFTQMMSGISSSKKSQEQNVIQSIQINSTDSNSSKVVVEEPVNKVDNDMNNWHLKHNNKNNLVSSSAPHTGSLFRLLNANNNDEEEFDIFSLSKSHSNDTADFSRDVRYVKPSALRLSRSIGNTEDTSDNLSLRFVTPTYSDNNSATSSPSDSLFANFSSESSSDDDNNSNIRIRRSESQIRKASMKKMQALSNRSSPQLTPPHENISIAEIPNKDDTYFNITKSIVTSDQKTKNNDFMKELNNYKQTFLNGKGNIPKKNMEKNFGKKENEVVDLLITSVRTVLADKDKKSKSKSRGSEEQLSGLVFENKRSIFRQLEQNNKEKEELNSISPSSSTSNSSRINRQPKSLLNINNSDNNVNNENFEFDEVEADSQKSYEYAIFELVNKISPQKYKFPIAQTIQDSGNTIGSKSNVLMQPPVSVKFKEIRHKFEKMIEDNGNTKTIKNMKDSRLDD